MSKRVYADENGTPRQLVEVPIPVNKPRQSNSQLSFNNDYGDVNRSNNGNLIANTVIPFNNANNNINSYPPVNNNNNRINDEYAVVPRVGSKKKTIIIKDEKGNEISRIVSSNPRDRLNDNLINNQRNNNAIAPLPSIPSQQQQQQQQLVPFQTAQQYQQPQQNALNSLVLQPQQYLLQPNNINGQQIATVPVLLAPQYSANPYLDTSRTPIINQTILEESISSARSKRGSAHHRTLEIAREVRTARERENEFKDIRRKYDDGVSLMGDVGRVTPSAMKTVDKKNYIYCCTFCERANTDTCQFCWKLCGFPVWFAVLIGSIFLLITVTLIIILVLRINGTLSF